MSKYFGTDGFRGEAGITLTADHAYKVGRFLGWYYNALRERNGDTDPARIVIGKDTRRSSYMFEYSLVAGLTASGADAYLLHVTTTPSVAYIARVDDFDCGIMISASHNPYYDNGIKLIDCYGEKMPEETLLLVEDYIDGKLHVFDKDWPELPFAHREHIGCTVDYVAGRNRYMGYLISLGIYSFKGVKVGLDCANGSSWNIAKSVFDALGADTYVINNNPNGLNINNNAGSTHIEGLQKFVVEKGLDVGFAYDGDADRCLCVDEKGNVITGDHKWIIAENAHAAIVTKDEYYQAQKAIRNVTPIQYKVGDDFALKGKICCGNCNRQLRHERQYGEMVFYCGYKRSAGKFSKCYGGYYREYSVNAKVARAIKTVFYALDVVNQGMQEKQSITVRCVDIEDLEKQAEAIRVEQIKLYESYADGVLRRDVYIEKKKTLSEKLAALQDSIRTEKEEQECADELDEEIRALTKQASEKTYIGGLTKECVDAFVSMVYLYDDQTMKIEFNCEDVIRRALEKYGA